MGKLLVPDALWEIVEPLLPEEAPKPKGGYERMEGQGDALPASMQAPCR